VTTTDYKRVVFLDVGDTLLYDRPTWADVISDVAGIHGASITSDALIAAERRIAPVIASRFRDGERHTTSLEKSQSHWTWRYSEMLGLCGVPERLIPTIAKACHTRFNDFDTWVLFEDARPLLDELDRRRRQDGLIVGVVSNWEEWLEPLLIHRDLARHFDFLVVSGVVQSEKPDEAIFDAALARAGLTRSQSNQAMHVGDSLTADVEGARALGIRPVLLDRDVRYPPERTSGSAVIRSLAELPRLIDEARG
jgi:putative hydrolase of the HAD superfamily